MLSWEIFADTAESLAIRPLFGSLNPTEVLFQSARRLSTNKNFPLQGDVSAKAILDIYRGALCSRELLSGTFCLQTR
jgi:hypothetical protein